MAEQPKSQKALVFILITAFLNLMGIGIIIPVLPFIVQNTLHTTDPNIVAFYVGWLMSIYAICQFFASPGLGLLSDKYGRRPILLICLLGSAIGYFFLGIGGAIWVYFLGRIIDGITGGNFSTIFAYVADITKPEERGKYYGLVGAAGGVGFMLGPVLGGFASTYSMQAPFYIAAAITLGNLVWGYYNLPESLHLEHRRVTVDLGDLNPFKQLVHVFSQSLLRWLLIISFLFFLGFVTFTSTNGLFMKDVLHWKPEQIGVVLFLVGVVDIIAQGFLIRKLSVILSESRLAIIGLAIVTVGYLTLTAIPIFHISSLIYVGAILFALGDGLFEPSISGLISATASRSEQGRVQGAHQSIQSIARIFGPIMVTFIYPFGANLVYFTSAFITFASLLSIMIILPVIRRRIAL